MGRFFIARDLTVELGIITEEKEFVGLFGPYCWMGRKTPMMSCGKKLMCMDLLKTSGVPLIPPD